MSASLRPACAADGGSVTISTRRRCAEMARTGCVPGRGCTHSNRSAQDHRAPRLRQVCTSHPIGEPAINTFDGYTMRPMFTPEVWRSGELRWWWHRACPLRSTQPPQLSRAAQVAAWVVRGGGWVMRGGGWWHVAPHDVMRFEWAPSLDLICSEFRSGRLT